MNSNGTEMERVVYPHRTGAVGREGFVNLEPVLAPEYLLPSQWISVLAPNVHFRYGPNTCSVCAKLWHRTYPIRSTLEIGAAQPSSVTEIAPKSLFVFVNKSPIWYDFRALARAILCDENFIFLLFISCQIPSAAFPKVRRRCSWRVRLTRFQATQIA